MDVVEMPSSLLAYSSTFFKIDTILFTVFGANPCPDTPPDASYSRLYFIAMFRVID